MAVINCTMCGVNSNGISKLELRMVHTKQDSRLYAQRVMSMTMIMFGIMSSVGHLLWPAWRATASSNLCHETEYFSVLVWDFFCGIVRMN